MKRRTSNLPVRVIAYGLGEPTGGRETIEHQLLLAHRYGNALVEVSRNQRAAYLTLTREVSAEIATVSWEIEQLDAWIEAGRDMLGRQRAEARRRVRDPILAECVKQLRECRARHRQWIKGLRRALKGHPALVEMYERVLAAKKALRAACGVYWGSYLLVEKSIEQAEEAARREGTAVRFRGWRGYSDRVGQSGRLGVQLQRGADGGLGMPVAELLSGADTRAQVVPCAPRTQGPSRSAANAAHRERCAAARKRREPLMLRLRVASTETGEPIWGEWPMVVSSGRGRTSALDHRPLPPDGRIKCIVVHRERVGTRFRWRALVTVEAESMRAPVRRAAESAGLDVGWRRVDGGLRVAYLVDDRGHQEQLVLPDESLSRLAHADSLRSIRDQNFDLVRPRLVAWLATHPHPEWLARLTRTLVHWKSSAKLTRVGYRWREQRFDGDAEMFAEVDAWRRQDRHLYQWEASKRDRALRARRDLYRCAAARWTERYSRIVVEDFDLREMAAHAKPEDEPDERGARVYRHVAAVSELREALASAAGKRGSEIVEASAVDTTRRCHSCGARCAWDAATLLRHRCEHCGAEWDQDANAARNLLAAGRERSGGDETPGTARVDASARSGRGLGESEAAE